jgi:hypothetical protein
MLRKVISGGQTGADQAGLRAARRCGIPTGGYAPMGWLTLDGPQQALLQGFGLREHDVLGYGARTDRNVEMSDGTVRLARVWNSPGERRTLRAIQRLDRPYFDVDFPFSHRDWHLMAVQWILENHIKVLNVAGNSETTAFGIGAFAEEFLVLVFGRVK